MTIGGTGRNLTSVPRFTVEHAQGFPSWSAHQNAMRAGACVVPRGTWNVHATISMAVPALQEQPLYATMPIRHYEEDVCLHWTRRRNFGGSVPELTNPNLRTCSIRQAAWILETASR